MQQNSYKKQNYQDFESTIFFHKTNQYMLKKIQFTELSIKTCKNTHSIIRLKKAIDKINKSTSLVFDQIFRQKYANHKKIKIHIVKPNNHKSAIICK